MSMGKPEWPEIGDLVVATVVRVERHGAYVSLDEHGNKEGLLHISEISSRWVRNIRNHVRERQKVVLQVMRVVPAREQIDLSLRRVTQDERRKKLEEWKKHRKAETLLRSAATELKMDADDLYAKAGIKLADQYGSLYAGFEAAAKKGIEALLEANVPKKISKTLEGIAKDKIVVKGVTIQGELEITSMEPKGVEEIKSTLLEATKMALEHDAVANLYSLGAPKYRIEVTADDYKKAEAALEKVVRFTQEVWASHDGKISFNRG
ncbi:MAG: translation initiation factor IF-2 subunit alpha [Candidatus Bathyarchaeota archaeon]|nr:MAG: translation initiation factor IF-2 subunit alpha [Candidatus Bathyarchaeota archaeon]